MNSKLNLVRKYSFYLVISFVFLLIACTKVNETSIIPNSSNQMILVLTDSITATNGILYSFERDNSKSDWKQLNNRTNVVLGRSGLGLGIGLHNYSDLQNIPAKVEGDGRSPAGIFRLSSVFGYNSADNMTDIKMPYFHITEMSECVDDVSSKYYNQIVQKDEINNTDTVDWQSSEKMNSMGIYYALGVVIDHNSNSIEKGSGSCIFLHNWADSNETMAGCTAMVPEKLKEIVFWLDDAKNPILIQLTSKIYFDLIKKWDLPEVKFIK
ncbi:MAG: L,D-transpeptidase family protein [Melioribacteraceae bacterium]|jgi:L,D-peptidoglycan transpeptidase YkuD (ErfK/YbiS/YcfS/YnhG family)|nr:L,D-transpeptidase family protein [Melioribacteraceae bacterium]